MENDNKLSTFENGLEWINWLKIVLSPTILFGIVGFVVFISMEDETAGAYLLGFITALGAGLGMIWANNIKKKHGTTQFISRTDASPDIDEMIENNKK